MKSNQNLSKSNFKIDLLRTSKSDWIWRHWDKQLLPHFGLFPHCWQAQFHHVSKHNSKHQTCFAALVNLTNSSHATHLTLHKWDQPNPIWSESGLCISLHFFASNNLLKTKNWVELAGGQGLAWMQGANWCKRRMHGCTGCTCKTGYTVHWKAHPIISNSEPWGGHCFQLG